ncbi:MAG: butyrate kinase [Synergistaceae bacterium]|jgi:butyrate kinase|nr:butyrate kinase [Synergistaceae bacterium]
MSFRVLVLNPGATSTKIAVFEDEKSVFQESVPHGADDLKGFAALIDQIPYRKKLISDALARAGVGEDSFDAVVGRGGLLAPLPSGIYEVSPALLDDARGFRHGEHASNLGPLLAGDFAAASGCKAYVVDPVSTDEWTPVSRVSGLKGIDRVCHFHALNHKAVARLVASELGKAYEDATFIVVHMGTGVSVGVHVNGRVVDVNDAMNEGAFSVDRAGGVPTLALIDMCYSGKFSHKEMKRHVNGLGGIFSYLGTMDMREVERMMKTDEGDARRVVEAFAYQIAKDVGSMAAVCSGNVDRIVITGGMARFKELVDMIASRVEFIAPIKLVPGEEEMESLASGALRVLRGAERAKVYAGKPQTANH